VGKAEKGPAAEAVIDRRPINSCLGCRNMGLIYGGAAFAFLIGLIGKHFRSRREGFVSINLASPIRNF
jgi:hypothetical protein